MSEQFQEFMKEFAAHVGIEDVADFETSGVLTIDDLEVEIMLRADEDNDEIVVASSLGAPPAGRERNVYRSLLEANMLWAGTGGATLGMNAETGEAVLAISFPIQELDGEALADVVAGFKDVALYWRNFIETSAEGASADEAMEMPDMGVIRP